MSKSIDELKHRVQARKHELQKRLEKLQADALGASNDEQKQLEAKLSEIDEIIGQGWDNVTDNVAQRLNEWLK